MYFSCIFLSFPVFYFLYYLANRKIPKSAHAVQNRHKKMNEKPLETIIIW